MRIRKKFTKALLKHLLLIAIFFGIAGLVLFYFYGSSVIEKIIGAYFGWMIACFIGYFTTIATNSPNPSWIGDENE